MGLFKLKLDEKVMDEQENENLMVGNKNLLNWITEQIVLNKIYELELWRIL